MLKAPELANVDHNAEFEIGMHTEKLKEMTEVKATLLRDRESIRTVIQAVGNRKDEAVQFTYKTISANFEKIFETLVPAGRACLNWILPDGSVTEGEDVQVTESLLIISLAPFVNAGIFILVSSMLISIL